MRNVLAFGAVAALVAVAACNSGEGPPPPAEPRAEAAENAAANNAGPVDIAAIMHDRHENYEDMGKAMKGIGDQLKADAPSVETIQRNAAAIAANGPLIPTWFPAGSGPEAGRTRAKAEIWSDPDTFRQRAQAFQAESARFHQVAQGGDVAAIRAARPALAETCKNCHDRFRGPELPH